MAGISSRSRPRLALGQRIGVGLAAGAIAISVNTLILFAANLIPLATAHGGILTLIKPVAAVLLRETGIAAGWNDLGLPGPANPWFQAGFHIAVGLVMAIFYALILERILSGPAWLRGVIYALPVWLANTFIVLPLIGEGIAGSSNLTLAGMIYFAVAHTIFFVLLAVLYRWFQTLMIPVASVAV